jgi:thiol-disulfide isomerase/thioredoxin
MKFLLSAVLYLAVATGANAADLDTLNALRDGDMKKLNFHAEPVAVSDAVFTDRDGAEFTLADWQGKVVLLNFWATWCAPCRQEKPALDALQRELGGEDFEVIAIATGRNGLEDIERFNTDVGVTALETHLDPQSTLARAMTVPGLPVTVVVNREGAEIARLMGGADWTAPSARAIVERLIATP